MTLLRWVVLVLTMAAGTAQAFEYDVELPKLREFFGAYQLRDLHVGDTAFVTGSSHLCLTTQNELALLGASSIGEESEYRWNLFVTLKPGKRLDGKLTRGKRVDEGAALLATPWQCDALAVLLGEAGGVYKFDSLNGKNRLSELLDDL